MRRRNPTESYNPDERLTIKQATAIDLLIAGKTLTDTAAALDVGRDTISEWCNHHVHFQAQLNARRQELWADHVERLRGLLPKALTVLEEELQGEGATRLQAAVHICKMVGLYGQVGAPTGPTTPQGVEQAQIRQAVQRAQTVLTLEDLRLAEERRESDRSLSALMSVNLGPLPPRP